MYSRGLLAEEKHENQQKEIKSQFSSSIKLWGRMMCNFCRRQHPSTQNLCEKQPSDADVPPGHYETFPVTHIGCILTQSMTFAEPNQQGFWLYTEFKSQVYLSSVCICL